MYVRYSVGGIKQPETVVFRMNGMWFDASRRIIKYEEAEQKLKRESEVFLKIATDSFGGHGVYYYFMPDGEKDIYRKIDQIKKILLYRDRSDNIRHLHS